LPVGEEELAQKDSITNYLVRESYLPACPAGRQFSIIPLNSFTSLPGPLSSFQHPFFFLNVIKVLKDLKHDLFQQLCHIRRLFYFLYDIMAHICGKNLQKLHVFPLEQQLIISPQKLIIKFNLKI
jgi:hypothetical protein